MTMTAKEIFEKTDGQHVIINPIISCGHCDSCKRGEQQLCRNAGLFGREVEGSMCEFVHLPVKYLHALPDSVSLADATIIETLATVRHAQIRLGIKPGEAIVHSWLNSGIERAQRKVEARNFDTRKNLLKYDDVMNDQRKVIYEQRREMMRATDIAEQVVDMRHEVIEDLVARTVPANEYAEKWDTHALHEEVLRACGHEPIVASDGTEAWSTFERLKQREPGQFWV